ncbi:phenoloxidase-activating factor 2-like isoform X2 [Colias croceus]|uniref:phenoloxidase-activating factor 2-like isoform X2 n=1 Tax=Colias crocea TaxID=72248 RepID=UPI001E27FF62|nr:phenoloxidase-activating factor 2-like isoform X2 [Colias croceus]
MKCDFRALFCFLLLVHNGHSEEINDTDKQAQNTSPTKAPLGETCVTNKQLRGRCVKPNECMETEDFDDILAKPNAYRSPYVCETSKQCCPRKSIIVPKVPELSTLEGCGWSYSDNPGLRVFSDHAGFREYPWMIAVLRKSTSSENFEINDYVAGGTLIHPSVVMTAAHRILKQKANEVKCRAGEWDIKSTNEVFDHQERNVKNITIHETFSFKVAHNNIALLILEQPFDLTNSPHIGIACLGQHMPPVGTTCISMGWHNHVVGNTNPVTLKKVQLPIYDKQKCQTELSKLHHLRHWQIHDSIMCAGGMEGEDTCTGDGGSPIVCEIQSEPELRYAVFGIHAFRIRCGIKDSLPGLNTDVTYEYDWIKSTFTGEGFNTSTFEY